MAISCEPEDLAAAAKCYCMDLKMQQAIIVYLLAQIAGGSTEPNALAEEASQFQALSDKSLSQVTAYLLCAIVNK